MDFVEKTSEKRTDLFFYIAYMYCNFAPLHCYILICFDNEIFCSVRFKGSKIFRGSMERRI